MGNSTSQFTYKYTFIYYSYENDCIVSTFTNKMALTWYTYWALLHAVAVPEGGYFSLFNILLSVKRKRDINSSSVTGYNKAYKDWSLTLKCKIEKS